MSTSKVKYNAQGKRIILEPSTMKAPLLALVPMRTVPVRGQRKGAGNNGGGK